MIENIKEFAKRILNAVESAAPAARMALKPEGDSHAEAREEKPWKPLEIPECGIDFKRYHSKGCDVFVCAWRNEFDSHVYEVRIRKVEE